MAEQRTKFATARRRNDAMMKMMGESMTALEAGDAAKNQETHLRSWALNPKYLDKLQSGGAHTLNQSEIRPSTIYVGPRASY